jgi:hypothetical protein
MRRSVRYRIFLHPLIASGTCILALLATGCTNHRPKPKEPVEPKHEATAPAPPPATPAAPLAPAPSPPADTCRVVTKLTGELPFYLAGKGVVVTRLMKPCVTQTGERGFEEDTPWLAMGFPCTGGNGRIEIKGSNYQNAKMVSFILGTDCPMMPSDRTVVDKLVREQLDLPTKARLMAMTPLVVQYWEVPGMTDADVGFAVELRSQAALGGQWRQVRENKPMHVKLYGRENAWVQGGHFYAVDADIKITGRYSFQLEVLGVKSLAGAELEEVKARCENLRPRRNCSDVFPST